MTDEGQGEQAPKEDQEDQHKNQHVSAQSQEFVVFHTNHAEVANVKPHSRNSSYDSEKEERDVDSEAEPDEPQAAAPVQFHLPPNNATSSVNSQNKLETDSERESQGGTVQFHGTAPQTTNEGFSADSSSEDDTTTSVIHPVHTTTSAAPETDPRQTSGFWSSKDPQKIRFKKRYLFFGYISVITFAVICLPWTLPTDEHASVRTWTPELVGNWVETLSHEDHGLQLEDLAQAMRRQHVDGSALCALDLNSIRDDFGITAFGLRQKLYKQVRAVCSPSKYSWAWVSQRLWQVVVPPFTVTVAYLVRSFVLNFFKSKED